MFFALIITGGEITDLFDRTSHEEFESCLPEDSPSACDEKETLHDEEQDKGITPASKKLKGGIWFGFVFISLLKLQELI